MNVGDLGRTSGGQRHSKQSCTMYIGAPFDPAAETRRISITSGQGIFGATAILIVVETQFSVRLEDAPGVEVLNWLL